LPAVPTAARRYGDEVEGESRGPVTAARTALVLVWVAATLLGLAVAATTRIGPVLLTVTARHGVHVGDVVAFVVAYTAALVITLRLLRSRRPVGRARRVPPDGRDAATIGPHLPEPPP
jgi:hypothetical protein